ncbi:MAG: hypothetical protein ACK2UA_14225 [Anaerolineae bacterium]|jgi:hypothetical protein
MGLLRKLRVLAGALVHKPFMPKPGKVDLGEGGTISDDERSRGARLDSGEQAADVTDSERVADLLAKQQREQAD